MKIFLISVPLKVNRSVRDFSEILGLKQTILALCIQGTTVFFTLQTKERMWKLVQFTGTIWALVICAVGVTDGC